MNSKTQPGRTLKKILHKCVRLAYSELIKGSSTQRKRFLQKAFNWLVQRIRNKLIQALIGQRFNEGKPTDKLVVAAVLGGGLGDHISSSGFLERFFVENGHPILDIFISTKQVEYAEFIFQRLHVVHEVLGGYLHARLAELL